MNSLKNDTVYSGVNMEERHFTWAIKNFNNIRKIEELVDSQKISFQVGKTIDYETKLTLYLQYNKDANGQNTYIGVFLELDKGPAGPSETVHCTLKVRIQKKDETNPIEYNAPVKLTKGTAMGFSKVIPDTMKSEALQLVDGCLPIKIGIILYAPQPNSTVILSDISLVEKNFNLVFLEKLQQDLLKLLNMSLPTADSETKIVAKDNVEFIVHRGILSVRSPVFETMFQTDMKESRTGIVQITELNSKAISILLEFIYTGKLKKDWSNSDVIVELVYAAGKYELQDLLDFLDQVVGKICDKENVGKLLNLSKKLEMKHAEVELFDFMKKNILDLEDMMSFVSDSVASTVI